MDLTAAAAAAAAAAAVAEAEKTSVSWMAQPDHALANTIWCLDERSHRPDSTATVLVCCVSRDRPSSHSTNTAVAPRQAHLAGDTRSRRTTLTGYGALVRQRRRSAGPIYGRRLNVHSVALNAL